MRWLRLSRLPLWYLLKNSGLDGHGLSVCWNPDCRCHNLLPKSRCLLFSGFLLLNVSSPAVGDILRSVCCRELWAHLSRLHGACVLLICDFPALGQLKPDWSVSISLLFVIRGFTLHTRLHLMTLNLYVIRNIIISDGSIRVQNVQVFDFH